MTRENDGEIKSSNDYREDFERRLDEILDNLVIPKPKISNDISEVVSLTYDQLKSISPQECLIFSYQLKQYSYYIQQKQNRFKNIEHWAKESLRKLNGRYAQNYGSQYSRYDERCDMLLADNKAAQSLVKIIIEAGSGSNELDSLAFKLADLARTLTDLSNVKRKED